MNNLLGAMTDISGAMMYCVHCFQDKSSQVMIVSAAHEGDLLIGMIN